MMATKHIIAIVAAALIIVILTGAGKKGKSLTVYGSMSCPWTVKQIEYLNHKKIPHVYVDCNKQRCPKFVKGFPTIKTSGGKIVEGFSQL